MTQLDLFNARPAAGTQNARLLSWLETRGPIDPLTSWLDLGIYRLSARVDDLKKLGHNIATGRKQIKNRFGEPVTVAEYKLEGAT